LQVGADGLPSAVNITNNTIESVTGHDLKILSGGINGTWVYDQKIGSYYISTGGVGINFRNSTFGEISFLSLVTGNGDNLFGNESSTIRFKNNSVHNTAFNVSANISLYTIGLRGFANPTIMYDSLVSCSKSTLPNCHNFTGLTSSIVNFNVTHWTNYSIQDVDSIPPSVRLGINDTTIEYFREDIRVDINTTDNVGVTYTLSNITYPNATVMFNSTDFNGTFNFSSRLNLTALVTFTVSVLAQDAEGNRNTTTSTFTVTDTLTPQADIGINDTTIEYFREDIGIQWNTSDLHNVSETKLNITYANLTIIFNSTELDGSVNLSSRLNLTSIGTITINLFANDTTGNRNTTTSTFTVTDTVMPEVVNFSVYLPNASTYNPGITYQFNTTVTDLRGVQNVFLSFNGTNISALTNGKVYYVNFTNLSNGATYEYYWVANDTSGNTNTTQTFTYYVSFKPIEILSSPSSPSRGTLLPINEDGTVNVTLNPDGSIAVALQLQQCIVQQSFFSRLKDTCAYSNGICEDGENPIKDKEECKVTTEAINCKGERCIWKEIWLAKALMFLAIPMIVFHRKNYNIWIVLILSLLAINFFLDISVLEGSFKSFTPVENPSSPIWNIGGKVMPSNPIIGFLLLVGLLAVILYMGNKKLAERKTTRRGKR